METTTYESELVASKTATEQIIDLRHTLRYLGVHIKIILPSWRQQFSANEFHSSTLNIGQES